MALKPFKFKQFSVEQDRCAMKVGTDGVLLGAWASIDHLPETILDIGAGTGLISLMLAQRTVHPFIEAIEIDDKAYEQCTENFEASPWANRLFCYHASLLEFTEEVEDQFDLIVCNPPFFDASFKTGEASRNLARFQDALPFEHLIYAVRRLLSAHGKFSVILPYDKHKAFIDLARSVHLHANSICSVKGTPDSNPKRALMEFSFAQSEVKVQSLVIETSRHQYTEAYRKLTEEFYLKI